MAESPLYKAMQLLRILIESSSPMTLTDLTTASEMNASTTMRVMRMLAEDGFVAFDPPSKLYRPGAEFLRLAAISLNDNPLFSRLRPALAALAHETGETVAFNLYDVEAGMMMLALTERSPQPLGYDIPLGRRDYLHAGASGKAILAFLGADEIDAVLNRHGLPQVTDGTVIDRATLIKQLEDIRETGYALSFGERVDGAVGTAAPVFGENGRVAGSILVTVPSFRHTEERQQKINQAVIRTAEMLRAGGLRKEQNV
ncbi:IclR family transcriptional regulator [uncultured Sneathiella sp.]|uniref:IclR family transcriptional regulator n=1 Tax=uncultured Sneathiella sp. TaxID=879315 RepID=UPI0025982850|nr:IclR family transcriptional regulator [uncultured Sneathiella sp.]